MDIAEFLARDERKDLLRFVTAGSVDDGKSTLIGRLLYESRGIYEDQLASIRRASGRRGSAGGDLDLSLVTDGLKAEREQGITIDVAYRYFSTPQRKFIIVDAPGHEQYTRNMATGASVASLAVVLVDASKGLLTQSRRHAFIAALLGIPHLVVAVNKMDLVGYSQRVFEDIRGQFTDFASRLQVRDLMFIPVSALKGDNVVSRGERMGWYEGSTLLNHLETVHVAGDRNFIDLRFPVQYVLRTGPDSRAYLGTVASGILRPGDEVAVLPKAARARVATVFGPDGPLPEAFPPLAVGLTLDRNLDVSRGDMLVHVHNLPHVGHTLEAMLLWMGEEPLQPGRPYLFKHTTRTVTGTVAEVRYRVDVNTLHRQPAAGLALNEIGRAVLSLGEPLACDPYDLNRATGAIIVIDRVTNNTVGAAMVLAREPEELLHTTGRWSAQPQSANVRRHRSRVSPEERRGRTGHAPATVWLTGLSGSGKSTLAYALERRLFDLGCSCHVLDGENLRLSVSRDLSFAAADRSENSRRAAEIARLSNEAGMICICALLSPYAADRNLARQTVGGERFLEIYLHAPEEVRRQRDAQGLHDKARRGEVEYFTGLTAPYEEPTSPDLSLPTAERSVEQCVDLIVERLKARGILP